VVKTTRCNSPSFATMKKYEEPLLPTKLFEEPFSVAFTGFFRD
jgi:hypothetical protein